MNKIVTWVGVFLLASGFMATAWAEEDEKDLLKEQKQTDHEIFGPGQESERAGRLAQKFEVDPAVVREMRGKGNGWGEVSIQLAMAAELSRREPGAYPTTAGALARVRTLRAEGRGYGEISKEQGFKLGPVIREVHRARTDLKGFEKPAKLERPTGGMGSFNRPDRLDRPGKPERIDRPSRLKE